MQRLGIKILKHRFENTFTFQGLSTACLQRAPSLIHRIYCRPFTERSEEDLFSSKIHQPGTGWTLSAIFIMSVRRHSAVGNSDTSYSCNHDRVEFLAVVI
jgi:hypothetical protein